MSPELTVQIDDQLAGSPQDRDSITVPMSKDMKARIIKAAGRNELASSRYIRRAVYSFMEANDEWSIPGPRKGNR